MFCRRPFEQFYVTADANVHLCCPEWMDRPAGNLMLESPLEIWKGSVAQELRSSILDGSFRHCTNCPLLPGPAGVVVDEPPPNPPPSTDRIHYLTVAYDPTCNLTCPSCRSEHKTAGPGAGFIQKTLIDDAVFNLTDIVCSSGSGDPLASSLFLNFLKQMPTLAPNTSLSLQTNGLLLTPEQWKKLDAWGVGDRILELLISIDAASPETYAKNRGGDFNLLVDNLRYARTRVPYLQINMVVQENNFREMPAFLELSAHLRTNATYFSAIQKWENTYSTDEYMHRAVHLPFHPNHAELLNILAHPAFSQPNVTLARLPRSESKTLESKTPYQEPQL